jgi:predicted site-specific integrase-resolvase
MKKWESTFKSNRGLAASDVIRSMKRLGFANDEIYDTLAGIGLPGEQVQLLIDRVSAEFEEAELESQISRLGSEVREIFEEVLKKVQLALIAKMDSLSRELQFLKAEVSKLGNRVIESQSPAGRIKDLGPRGPNRRRC